MRHARLAPAMVLALVATGAHAADWPGWLGPNQDGTAPDTGLFAADAEFEGLEVRWRHSLGKAYSAVAVAGDTAVTMYGDGESDWLVAIDVATGERRWRYRVDDMWPKIGGAHGGQLSMPVIDGDVVYGLGAKGQLFAVGVADGAERWRFRIDERHGAKMPHFGFATTPLVVGDLLFVQMGGGAGQSLVAVGKKDGKKRWAVGDEHVGYQSPIYATVGGVRQIVAVTNRSIMGLRPADGRQLWRFEHELVPQRDGWSTAIQAGDGVFVLTGQSESVAVRVERDGERYGAAERWRSRNLKRNFAMPVAHDGHLYGFDAEFLTCVDAATGEQKWKSRTDAAGLILVDDHLVLYASDGHVLVGPASSDGFEATARVKVAEKAGFTFPTFAAGGIFVRNLEEMARVDLVR